MSLPAQLLKVRFGGDAVRAQELMRMQDNVGTLLNEVAGVPLLSGVQIADVDLSATAANVSHGLGRAWTNYLVTYQSANATVWSPSNDNPTQYLTLQASGAVTVNLLVW